MIFLILSLLAAPLVASGEPVRIKAGGLKVGEVAQVGFRVNREGTVTLSGAGALIPGSGSKRSDGEWELTAGNGNIHYYGWILDAQTRKPVWHALDRYHQKGLAGTYAIADTLRLPPGDYELYYAAVRDSYFIFGHRHQVEITAHQSAEEAARRDLFLEVSAPPEQIAPAPALQNIDKLAAAAIVSLIRTGDDANRSAGFSLNKPTDLHIYAIGEGFRRAGVISDYAWISDVTDDHQVWAMSVRSSDYAGGSRKNIASRETIHLGPGHYMVHYVSDDSHAFGDWNTLPPDDPHFWGVTVTVAPEDAANVGPLGSVNHVAPVLAMTRVTEGSNLVRGMTLAKSLRLRVRCMGEESDHWGLVDHGWIADAFTGEKKWSMAGRPTLHAGGAYKNRVIDETVRLEKGSYLVHYVSDASHAYGHWNAIPPANGENWGISLWTVKPEDRGQVSFFEPGADLNSGLVAEIVKVGNQSYQERSFVLHQATRLRIVSIGEGTAAGMADYGWLENDDTGRVVWVMTYARTRPAGGAEKNRLSDDLILLPAGKYKLFYETDDSHAYASWNDNPPDNAERYGITLLHAH